MRRKLRLRHLQTKFQPRRRRPSACRSSGNPPSFPPGRRNSFAISRDTSAKQRHRREGITYILFTMTRDGRVLNARIERSAGNVVLDREGLELLTRAEPLPPLPQDQPGETLRLVVPIQFFMRR